MKTIKGRILSIIAMLTVNTSLYAQLPSVTKERMMIESALCTIENLQANMTLSDEESISDYLSLFSSENASIYNDLLGIATKDTLSVKEYVKRMHEDSKSPQINITNVNYDKVWNDNGIWKLQMSFDKTISYSNNCGIYFSSNDFYQKPYKETVILSYNESTHECLIDKIEGNINSSRSLPNDYYVYIRDNERDNELLYASTPDRYSLLRFNRYDQAIITSGVQPDQFRYPDADVSITPLIDNTCRTIKMAYKARHYRAKGHFDMPMDFYNLSVSSKNLETKSSGMEFGVDFGYGLFSSEKFRLSIFGGLGYSSSKIDLTLNSNDYSYSTNEDIDKENYTRCYTNIRGAESVKLSHAVIPIYLDAEFSLHQYVSLFANIGIRNYIKIGESHNDFTLQADEVYGEYKQYNMILDAKWGFNNFCINPKWQSSTDTGMSVNSYSVDAFGGLGLRIHPVLSMPLYIDLGASYVFGITNVFESKDINSFPVSYLSNGQSGQDIVTGLGSNISTAKRQHLKINVGVMVKF